MKQTSLKEIRDEWDNIKDDDHVSENKDQHNLFKKVRIQIHL